MQRPCIVCGVLVPRGSRCRKHRIVSPSSRAWHQPGAARVRANLLAQAACRICGSTDRLELHHVIPARQGGATTPGNLAVLCHAHHLAVERGETSLVEGETR